MPSQPKAPLTVGATATFWDRKPGELARRIWVTVEAVAPEGRWARVRLPSGWWPQVRVLAVSRLTVADPAEGRRA